MFQIGDVIVYGAHGVYKIEATEEKCISGEKKTYFVLIPANGMGLTIYAPIHNEYVLQKMRHLLTKDEIHKMIDAMPQEKATWIANENERKERYKSILSKGKHWELIKMIKALYAHKKEREAEGKRLHMSDERFLKDAEQLLYNEFQYVLELSGKSDLLQYIFARIDKQEK